MTFRYIEAEHLYLLDRQPIPSLTGMLSADGCNAHLDSAPAATVAAKAEWGTVLHLALQKVEYDHAMVTVGFEKHCKDWLEACSLSGWIRAGFPIWKNCEIPALANIQGLVFGFTPDRAAPEAVVEIKGTYSPHFGHGIQTALQVLGMGYDRKTPRFVAYFDKQGLKKLHTCGPNILRDGQTLDVFAEAERIIFEQAAVKEAA